MIRLNNMIPLHSPEAVKKYPPLRLGRDVGKVLERYPYQLRIYDPTNLTTPHGYNALLPITCQMIRNSKTLEITLPNLVLNFFTPFPFHKDSLGKGKKITSCTLFFHRARNSSKTPRSQRNRPAPSFPPQSYTALCNMA